MSSGATTQKEARQFQSGTPGSGPRVASSDSPRVTLAIEPDSERTFEFLRDLIADAEAWDAARKKDRLSGFECG